MSANIFDTHKFDAIDLNEVQAQSEAINKSVDEFRQEIEIDVAIDPEIREEFIATGHLSAENWFQLVYGISLKRIGQIIAYAFVVFIIAFAGCWFVKKTYTDKIPLEMVTTETCVDDVGNEVVYYRHTKAGEEWITTEKDDNGPFWDVFNHIYSFFNDDGVYSDMYNK